jgi:hypothetical protein
MEKVLNLNGKNIFTAGDDHVLFPVDDIDETILIFSYDIAFSSFSYPSRAFLPS